MPVRIFDENNWSNMEVSYFQDDNLQTNQQKIFSDSCMNFVYPEFLEKTNDQKNNNYSTFALTSGLKFSECFYINNPEQNGNGFVTYFSSGINSIKDTAQRYWSIVEPGSSQKFLEVSTSNFFAAKNSNYYFEIDFLPNNRCRISHDYYNTKYYLNVNFLTNKAYFLSASPNIFDEESLYKQSFEYILDEKNNNIVLVYRKNNNAYTLVRQSSSLGIVSLTGSDIQLTIDNTFNIIPVKFNLLNTLSSFWFSYTKQFDTNNLNVDCNETVKTNDQIVFHSEFNNITSAQVPYNFILEKNSLTPLSKNVSKNENKNIRNYISLNTGSYQEDGNIRFSQNYLSKINEYNFVPGKISYFHTPMEMGQYDYININDSLLAESGSVYSNTPEYSDKVWKKNSNYKNTSNFGNPRGEINGTWLCSWLSGSSDPTVRPIWYDRYFLPAKTSRQNAFSANDVFSYDSHYDCVTNQAIAPTNIFDVKSQLTFEPYTLYAYYRIGKNDINEFINKNSNIILFDGISQYLKTDGTILAPENGYYSFNGKEYGVCETINSKNFDNKFSFLFTLNSKNFLSPIGHEILGNIKNNGLSVYADRSVTPFLRVVDDKTLNIYNSDFGFIDSITFNNKILDVVQLESLDDYFVLDSSGELFQINSQNTIFDSSKSNLLSSAIYHFSDKTYTYFLVSTAGDFVTYNRKTETIEYNNYPRYYSNSITLTSQAQSLKKIGTGMFIMDGKDPEIREGVRIFYLSQGNIKEWNISTNLVQTIFYNSSGSIVTFQMDDSMNFFIFDNQSTCHVHNSAGFVVQTISLPTSAGNVIASDFSSIYKNGENITTIYAFCTGAGNKNSIVKINSKTLKVSEDNLYTNINYSLSSCRNIPVSNTEYNHEILDVEYPRNTISVRMTLPNVYPKEDIAEINLKINSAQLKYGDHEFAIIFDSVGGYCNLIVDGIIVDTVSFQKGRYTLSECITEPLTFGATQYFAGTNLYEKLKQDNAFTTTNLKIKDVYFFTKAFDYYTVRFLQKHSKNIQPLLFNLPSENRNYTDTVEKFFRQRIPYHKSPAINISINNSKITDPSAKAYVQSQLNQILLNNVPYINEIKSLVWKENL